MVQSLSRFNAKSFLVGKELFIIEVYLEPLNKMEGLNENIGISLKLLELSGYMLIFHSSFGVIVFWLQLI